MKIWSCISEVTFISEVTPGANIDLKAEMLFSIISIVPHILFSSYVTQAMCSRDSFEVICSGNQKYSLVGHIQLVYN